MEAVETKQEQKELRILIVEDDHEDYLLARDMLAESGLVFQTTHISAPSQAEQALLNGDYDVCLLDNGLGEIVGLDLLRQARSKGVDLPIVLLTGQSDSDMIRQAIQAGASDYLVKGRTHATALERAILFALERSRAEREKESAVRALTDSEAKLRILAEASPNFFWILDAQGRLEFVSQSWTDFTGLSMEQMRSEGVEEIVHPEDREHLRNCWMEAHQNRKSYECEFRVRNFETGEYRWMLARAFAQTTVNGDVIRWLGSTADIHNQRTEAARLSQLVDARTSELTAMAYSLAHDMRQYARGVSVNASLITEDIGPKLEESELQILERLRWNAVRLHEMVEDILRHLRLGTQPIQFNPLNLSQLAEEEAQILSSVEWDCGHCRFEIEQGLRTRGDETLLRSVIHNLFHNACKFGGEGGVTVKFGFDAETSAFYVQDTGIGFNMKYAENLFRPFEKLHGQDLSGTGIGLANVKRIVARHGGDVWADSEVGKGTTIWFTLRPERVDFGFDPSA